MNWPDFFLNLALRGLVISSVAAFAVWKLRGRKRTVAAAFALCALLILPAAQILPRWEVTMPGMATAVEAVASLSSSWKAPVAVWSVGFLLIAARLLPGWLTLQKWRRRSARATKMKLLAEVRDAAFTLDLHPVPEVRLTHWRTMPAACGFWRGTVFLPADALRWTPEQLRMVLLHEFAHLKRRDPGMQALGHLACALHWFNPFVWMLHRTWLREREMACDALVLSTGVAPRGYAMHLVDIAEKFRSLLRQPLPSAAMAGPGLEQRVRTILQYVPRGGENRRGLGVAVLLSACALVTAAATFLPRPPSPLPVSPEQQEVNTRLSADPFPAEP
ncbi:MAG TPA: M56 family metallopeptidase [Verrucomicrobiales bacterium]|nr:M56 family metallopeptidase [Verrucomicrobiales bacterium]